MPHDRELEIRSQFLDEAQEYLNSLDAALVGLTDDRVDTQKMNAALRAAHSIKGGASMMGFQVLSDLTHRLEDSLKVLKMDSTINFSAPLETLLLTAVDCLHRVIECDRHYLPIDASWLDAEVHPLFEQLHALLGDPPDESAASLLSSEDGQDLIPLLFETEVEGCLQRLESLLEAPNQPCLHEEVATLAQELNGLGEMLQLPAFSRLCESITQTLEAGEQAVESIAQLALQAWRRAQALIIVGQYHQIPTQILLETEQSENQTNELEVYQEDAIATLIPDMQLDWEALSLGAEQTTAEVISGEADLEQLPACYEALTETVAVDDRGYTDFQLAAGSDRSSTDQQVSDFSGLVAQPDANSLPDDQDATVRVPVKQLNQLNDLFGELTIDRNGLDLYVKRLRSLSQTLHDRVQTLNQANAKLRTVSDKVTAATLNSSILSDGVNSASDGSTGQNLNEPVVKSKNFDFDALELDRYSDLHLLSQQVMETIVQIQEVTEDIDLSLNDTEQINRNLNKTAKQLQSGLTQLRMRPLSDIVDRFPRALRELSLQHGKQVRLSVVGGNTLIDRNTLEMLNDPLMHLLRNAFDHGIEAPDDRRAKGKPAEGVIEIRASHQANRTVITVQDDGEGIAIDKIRQKAEHMGLDLTLLAAASDEELLSLIFEPGFSTRDRVTTLSGRGVGMDVVRNNLKQIRGEIKVSTQAERGTTFTLSVPFTLSTVRLLLVESQGMLLALPTDIVEALFLLVPEQIIYTAGSEVLNWQNQLVQLVRLQRWLKFNCPCPPHGFEAAPTIAVSSVVIVRQGTQRVGLQIDRCWGEQEATIRRVEGNLPLPAGFSNCTIMGNGRVVPLVNVSELLRWITSCERSTSEATSLLQPTALRPPVNQPQTVLIVDDSMTVRQFLALTLERAGYRVEQAKDGLEALERLESGSAVQAVVCDIELPHLDGYGLLAKIKADPALEQIPVTMLTSRSSDKHRQLATNLGADAYFSKPYNEQIFLKTLAELIQATSIATVSS